MDVCTTSDAVIEGGDGDCYSFAAATSALVNFDVSQSVPELTEPNGPMRTELAAALEIIMAYPKVAAFGIADINPDVDVDGQMVQAILSVIKGGIAGVAR